MAFAFCFKQQNFPQAELCNYASISTSVSFHIPVDVTWLIKITTFGGVGSPKRCDTNVWATTGNAVKEKHSQSEEPSGGSKIPD